MRKLFQVCALSALCSMSLLACGDDDDGEDSNGGSADGCYFSDDKTCQESDGIDQACGLLGGTSQACSKTNVDATCVYTEEGHSTTIYYYKASGGGAWMNAGYTAQEDCEDYNGRFSAK